MTLNAVVTGANGFIGSVLVKKIIDLGGNVVAIVRKGSTNRNRLPLSSQIVVAELDLNDIRSWDRHLSQYNPNVFYHLAWSGVGNSERNSNIQLSNIDSTLETISLAKRIGCLKWIGTGSQAEYGPLNRRISEDDYTEPTTLYGAAKLSAGVLARVQGKLLDLETVWVRIFSIYGPGDNSGWLLTDLINKLFHSRRPSLTLGEQLWDYLYVEDAAEALIALGISKKASGIFNLGSGQSNSLRRIIEMTRDMINPSLELGFGEIDYRSDQVMHLEANIDKLIRDTCWVPKTPLDVGIGNLINYMKSIINS